MIEAVSALNKGTEVNSKTNTPETSGAQPSEQWEAPVVFLLADIVKKTEASGPNAGTVDGTYSSNV